MCAQVHLLALVCMRARQQHAMLWQAAPCTSATPPTCFMVLRNAPASRVAPSGSATLPRTSSTSVTNTHAWPASASAVSSAAARAARQVWVSSARARQQRAAAVHRQAASAAASPPSRRCSALRWRGAAGRSPPCSTARDSSTSASAASTDCSRRASRHPGVQRESGAAQQCARSGAAGSHVASTPVRRQRCSTLPFVLHQLTAYFLNSA